ncbi:hypothetical protein NMK34_10595 [Micromonospora sp. BRA006-A]|uniref:hypothetical protein n=1 Tax=Micromonospora sp. BRA006-A TaxID=2962860 RepID=UPI00296E72B5|nr:hypothetical protein [Micromonospora sp. BRA006-A]MDW3847051.1 hypothetical protein [Micromonospora sp. BRA006-A]
MSAVLTPTRDLLTALDPLSHPDRTRRLVAWARTAPDRAQVCADLRRHDSYERRLALLAALATRDTAAVLAATYDPEPAIAATALTAAVRAGVTPADLTDRPANARRRVYRALRRNPAPAVADALIIGVRERFGDHEAAALLPACGPETVRAWLPDLEHALNPERLMRTHSDIVLARTGERLAAAPPETRGRIWAEAAGAVLGGDPARALDLLDAYAPEESLPGPLVAYGRLAAHDARRVVRLLTSPGRTTWLARIVPPRALLLRVATLPTGELIPLAARLRDHDRALAALLRAVAPSRRAELYDAALADTDTTALLPGTAVMEMLPAAVRAREAARVLTLPAVREREEQVRFWSAYLPWPQASASASAALRSGDAEERADGWRLLVAAARRSRDPRTVAQVVVRLGRLRNEQDPVRAAALTALATVAPLLTAMSAGGLTGLTTDAVDARDTSATTTTALSRLAVDVLTLHVDVPELAEWALRTIDAVSSDANVPVLRRLDTVLRHGQERVVFDRLRGRIEAGMARGRYGLLFALTHALGRRAWRLPELQDLLRRAIGPDPLPTVARTAVGLWLDDPRTRSRRVAEVLDVDASAVALDDVWTIVCTSRTDLLDRVLDRPPRGRFVENGKRWVPGPAPRAQRWLPRQQERYVALQARVVADSGHRVWQRAAAIRAAAGAGPAGRELLLRHVDASEVPVAEAALGALVWTDRPDEAFPLLLRYADGDRARVALYAAGRAARHVPPAHLAELLAGVLTGAAKVTSRKEAARLLARYAHVDATATLAEAYAGPGTHRDVRAAIVSAARQRLGTEATWAVLRAAVHAGREERRAVLGAYPSGISERHRRAYADLVATACRADDREVRRAAFDALGEWSPWLTGVTDLVVDRLTDPDETTPGIGVANLLRAGGDAAFRAALTRLVERDAADGDPGGPVTDRPARRRVESLAEGAALWSDSRPAGTDRAGLVEAARWLAGQDSFLGTATGLLVDLGRLDDLDEVAALCAGRPVVAVRTAQRVGDRLLTMRRRPDPAALAGTVAHLAGRGDLAGGLFAVALVAHGSEFGWKTPWRDLLTGLRRHPDADVREAAYTLDMS